MTRAVPFPTTGTWLNTQHRLSLDDLKGHVTLLDFWTYCCINCIHVLPDLKYLEHKYAGQPFVVIGVHSAKFENEQDIANIQSAIDRYEIEHPVFVDNHHELWSAYGIRGWPSFVLIDAQGKVQGQASGEGLRDTLDKAVQKLLDKGRNQRTLADAPLDIAPPKEDKPQTLRFPGKISFANVRGKEPTNATLFISDSNHNRIVQCTMQSATKAKIISTIGNGRSGYNDGSYAQAQFDHPQGLCAAGDMLYVCDTENHMVRAVDIKRKVVRTIAGTGVQQRSFGQRQGAALDVALNSPWDVVEKDGELYVAMAGPHQIWKIDLRLGAVEVFAGSGVENIVDGPRQIAQLAQPSGLSLSGESLYFADSEVSAIRRVNLETDEVETLVGQGLFDFGLIDGDFATARLQHCLGVHADQDAVYVADTYNHAVRKLNLQDRTVSTLIRKHEGDVCIIGDASCAELPLNEPNDVELIGKLLYIADTNNHLVRVFDLRTQKLQDVSIV